MNKLHGYFFNWVTHPSHESNPSFYPHRRQRSSSTVWRSQAFGRNPANQLRLVVYPLGFIYTSKRWWLPGEFCISHYLQGFIHPKRWLGMGFLKHQQYPWRWKGVVTNWIPKKHGWNLLYVMNIWFWGGVNIMKTVKTYLQHNLVVGVLKGMENDRMSYIPWNWQFAPEKLPSQKEFHFETLDFQVHLHICREFHGG